MVKCYMKCNMSDMSASQYLEAVADVTNMVAGPIPLVAFQLATKVATGVSGPISFTFAFKSRGKVTELTSVSPVLSVAEWTRIRSALLEAIRAGMTGLSEILAGQPLSADAFMSAEASEVFEETDAVRAGTEEATRALAEALGWTPVVSFDNVPQEDILEDEAIRLAMRRAREALTRSAEMFEAGNYAVPMDRQVPFSAAVAFGGIPSSPGLSGVFEKALARLTARAAEEEQQRSDAVALETRRMLDAGIAGMTDAYLAEVAAERSAVPEVANSRDGPVTAEASPSAAVGEALEADVSCDGRGPAVT